MKNEWQFSEWATCKLSNSSKWFTESDSNCLNLLFEMIHYKPVHESHFSLVFKNGMHKMVSAESEYRCTQSFPTCHQLWLDFKLSLYIFCCFCDNFSCSVNPWCSLLHQGRDISSWHLDSIPYWTHRWQSVFIPMLWNVSNDNSRSKDVHTVEHSSISGLP